MHQLKHLGISIFKKSKILNSRYFKIATVFLGILLVLYLVAPSLNPLDNQIFDFHDETQTGRITSFVGNLRAGNIPPRLAPEYSFNLGFPVFNFYAPSAYWITSVIALLGAHSIIALKFSFMLTVVCSFLFMAYLLRRFFDFYPAILGATVYASSTYFATEIVIRGNLAESWFLALFPLGLGLLIKHSRAPTTLSTILTPLVLALLFTSHNMLSLFAIGTVIVVALLLPRKKQNLITVFLALLIDSYFLIPAFFEGSLVQATTVAKGYNYVDHFLCPWQLWTAHGWQFGGSMAGCDADLMSFKIGKPHMLLGLSGMALFILRTITKKDSKELRNLFGFFMIITLGALFLTLSYSQFIWDALAPIMALFQFPWRFIVFGIFGFAFFAGYLFDRIKIPLKPIVVIAFMLLLFGIGRKYFIKPMHTFDDFQQLFNSQLYLNEYLAHNMREYLVVGADYETWHLLNPREVRSKPIGFNYHKPVMFDADHTVDKNTPFHKVVTADEVGDMVVNIHYFPFWQIKLNEEVFEHKEIDYLARPIVPVVAGDTLEIKYVQTPLEKGANALSVIALFIVFGQGLRLHGKKSKKKKPS